MVQYKNLIKQKVFYQNSMEKYGDMVFPDHLYNPRTGLMGVELKDILETNSKKDRESFLYAYSDFPEICDAEWHRRRNLKLANKQLIKKIGLINFILTILN